MTDWDILEIFTLTIWLHAKPLLPLQDFINAALEINPNQTFCKRTPKMPGKILWLLMAGGRLQESYRTWLYWEEAREHVLLEKVRTHLLFGGNLLHAIS